MTKRHLVKGGGLEKKAALSLDRPYCSLGDMMDASDNAG